MTDFTITLKNCAFFARHGLYSEEEVLGQRFFVDAELKVRAQGPLLDDDISNTIDYGAVFKTIERIVLGKRFFLIEALAQAIASAICAEFSGVRSLSITVRKPNAPVQGVLDFVEVTLNWPQGVENA